MRIARLVAAAVVATILAVLPSGPAWAHNSLTKASPAKNATLDEAPDSVELTFLQKVDPAALTITVTDAQQRAVPTGAARADGKTGSVEFGEPLGNGVYTVTYRVVSQDGHPVQGSYRFTVADPAASSAPSSPPVASPSATAVSAPAAEPVAASAPPDDSGRWMIAAGVALVAVLGVVALAVLRRRRTP
jgi:MYXO-CTERM domain-containing protein